MKLLLVEDEISKEQTIIRFLHEAFPDANIIVKHSISSGILAIRQQSYDYVLLDMSLPIYDNDDMNYVDDNEFEAFGGNNVLDEIDRRQSKCKVIVITAFDILGEGEQTIELTQIDAQLRENYPNNFIGTVFYNSSSVEWRNSVRQLLLNQDGKANENINC